MGRKNKYTKDIKVRAIKAYLKGEKTIKEICDELKRINPLFEIILTVDRDYFSSRYENL